MLKRIGALVMVFGVSVNANAACPAKLDGAYSGLGSYVEAKIQSMNPFAVALGYAEGWAQVWKFSGNTVNILKNYQAGTGLSEQGTIDKPVNTPFQFSFDRTTCSGQITSPGSGYIGFVVSDNGRHIHATSGSTDGPSFSTFDMFKQ